jgi:uncharacterized protein (TIGR03067 family)
MRVGLVLLLAASGLGVADRPEKKKKADPVKQEMKKLEGTWVLAAMEYRGRQYPQQMIQRLNYRLIFKGNKCTRQMRGRNYEQTFTVDPKKTPKTIDMVLSRRTTKGIYQLDGDTLKICESIGRGMRPTTFASGIRTRTRIWTWRREKR